MTEFISNGVGYRDDGIDGHDVTIDCALMCLYTYLPLC